VIARMNVGGPAVLIADTVRDLDAKNFAVRLITGLCDEDEADYLETQAPDVRAIRIGGLGRSVSPLNDSAALRELTSLLRDIQPDIVHTHTAKAGVVGRLAVQLAPIHARVIHTYHGHLLHGYFSPAKTSAVVATERVLARRTSRLVAVSTEVREDLLNARIGKASQFEVIPPGVKLGTLPDRVSARSNLGIPATARVVLLLGRVTRIKRPDRFAEAARIVHRETPDAYFLVAGAGDLEDELRNSMAGIPSTFLGWRSDIELLLAASDVLVLTSDNEGTPLSVIQAGLAGRPTVATRVGGLTSVVDDGKTGLLVDPDAQAVAAGLQNLLSQPSLQQDMGDEAQRQMKTKFSTRAMIDRHADLYRRVLET